MSEVEKGKKVSRRQFLKKAGGATAVGAITAVGLGAFANPSGVGKLIKAMADQVPAYSGSGGPENTQWNCGNSHTYCSGGYSTNGNGDNVCGNGGAGGTFLCDSYSCSSPNWFYCTSTFECWSSSGGHVCNPSTANSCRTFSCQPSSAYTPE